MLDNVEKLMWKYLLERGSVVDHASYYGTCTNWDEAEKCRAFIKEFGIDWKETKGVVDDYDHQFAGTFDDPAKVTFLQGTLVLNNGTKWNWYYEYDEPFNILELVKDFIPDPFAK
jgi:hypothetical protein